MIILLIYVCLVIGFALGYAYHWWRKDDTIQKK